MMIGSSQKYTWAIDDGKRLREYRSPRIVRTEWSAVPDEHSAVLLRKEKETGRIAVVAIKPADSHPPIKVHKF